MSSSARRGGRARLVVVGSLLAGALLVATSCGRDSPPENILLISIDTLRADRLGSYGNDRGLTPNLDRFAEEGVRFTNAISPSPWTTPAQMSLLTSLQPSSHTVTQGWREFRRYRDEGAGYRTLPNDVETLAGLLREHGYRTLALTGGGTVGGRLGFGRGFDTYLEDARKLTPRIWSQLASWLSDESRRPFFLFFHTFEVHAPYTRTGEARSVLTPDEVEELERFVRERPELTEGELKRYLDERGLLRVEVTSRLYDGGVRFTDRFLGELFRELKKLGLWNRTAIVVTSDHGEEFADHRPKKIYNVHCDTLYEELIRVPLLLRAPGRFREGLVVDDQVRLLDVAPTLLDLARIPVPRQMDGTSLVALLEGRERASGPRQAFSEALCLGPEWKSLRSGRYKYIAGFPLDGERVGIPGSPQWERLFDLRRDPGELVDRADAEPRVLGEMRSRLFRFFLDEAREATEKGESLAIDPELESQLRSLGYVD